MKWWEKTVEYLFVAKYFDEKILLAPLDGNEERLSDTIFSKENRWVVIEFKRNEKCVESEQSKFISYEEAKKELEGKDSHHFIIYGKFQEGLVLECKTYFSNKYINIQDALSSGIDLECFKDYIAYFTKFKKPPKDGDDGGLSFEEYALVACVNSEGKLVSCMTISEHLDMTTGKEKLAKKKVMKTMSLGR